MIKVPTKSDSLEVVAYFALERLSNMTSEEFRNGADREIREALAYALGWDNWDQWHEERSEP